MTCKQHLHKKEECLTNKNIFDDVFPQSFIFPSTFDRLHCHLQRELIKNLLKYKISQLSFL